MSKGTLYILSAPSGAGKTSLLKALCERDRALKVCVSHTTRHIRSGEEHGRHYHFVERPEFQKMVEDGAFLEYAEVFGNFYGTSEAEVRSTLSQGWDTVLEIDWQGARQVRKRFSETLSIFILPPSIETLVDRLSGRGQDSKEVIEQRMRQAVSEISHYEEFDYLVINEDFEIALDELSTIIQSQRLRLSYQAMRHTEQIQSLLKTKYHR
jgi:guanylate kinase